MSNKKNDRKDGISLKKPLVWAICSCIVALLLGIGAFTYLFLDLGGEKAVVEVPALVGKNIDEVEQEKHEHFKVEKEPIYSDTHQKGIIISQFPHENSRRVLKGEDITVTVRVSLGREELKMPDLYGFDCYEAACRLRELGTTVRFVYFYDSTKMPDEVIRSSPAPDSPIEKGERVTLFVCRERISPTVTVRNFCGKSYEDAVRELMRDGLTLGKVSYLPTDDEHDGEVIIQGLPEGAIVRWGSKIDIAVAMSGESSGFYMGGAPQDEIEDNTENGE